MALKQSDGSLTWVAQVPNAERTQQQRRVSPFSPQLPSPVQPVAARAVLFLEDLQTLLIRFSLGSK